ncbi:MAG: hypothetical protein U1E15_03215 [Hyphomicrobiales bacterium]
MSASTVDLDQLVQECIVALGEGPADAPAHPDTTMRERFFELMVLVLGNLYVARRPWPRPCLTAPRCCV